MRNRHTCIFLALLGASVGASAQWAVFRDPTAPRTKNDKPNLSAPAPRLNGKPDLTGIWEPESAPLSEIGQFLLPEGINGLGEDLPSKYFFNFFADVPMGKEPFQPAAGAMYQKMSQSPGAPLTLCPPMSIPFADQLPSPYKIVQTPRVMLFLYEADTVFRQVFSDGRKLPSDPQPSWLGYSVGRWEGDTFVAESVGFNDKAPLDAMQHPHSESLRVTERFRRLDFGHLEVQVTIDDPKIYTKPVTIRVTHRLLPDTEIIENFCSEGE